MSNTVEDENVVDDLIARGCIQLSRKYRTLGFLPEGKTGLQALSEVAPERAKELLARINKQAAEVFLRLNEAERYTVTLTRAQFNEYLRKTGRFPDGGKSAGNEEEEGKRASG